VLTVGFQSLVGTIAFVHVISVKVQTLGHGTHGTPYKKSGLQSLEAGLFESRVLLHAAFAATFALNRPLLRDLF
jgi:hypothetical protein